MSARSLLGRTDGLVYHYTSARTAFEHVLPRVWQRNAQLRLGRPGNDPWDGRVPKTAEVEDAVPYDGGERVIEFMRATEDAFERVRVACFTRDEPGFKDRRPKRERHHATSALGWARDRMWAQYADDHRGVCIAFDRRKLEEAFVAQLGGRGPHFAGDVVYSDVLDENLIRLRLADLGTDPAAFAVTFRQRVAEQHLLRKRLDWAGEREYRLVLFDDLSREQYAMVQVGECVKALIVGHRFSDAYAPTVEWVCSALHIRAYRLHYSGYISLSVYPQLRKERAASRASARRARRDGNNLR